MRRAPAPATASTEAEPQSPLGLWFARHPGAKNMDLARAANVAEAQVSRWRNGAIPQLHALAIERWTFEIDPDDFVAASAWAAYAEARHAARKAASSAGAGA